MKNIKNIKKAFKELEVQASTCVLCDLSKGRTNVVFGRGNASADLMLIGEGPGAEEDEKGLPFVGRSGRLLQKILLDEIGLEAEASIYITNVVKCRPPDNRAPFAEEVGACSLYLQKQIQLVAPKVIVPLGNSATQSLLKTDVGITKNRGEVFSQVFSGEDYKIIPSFHPAAIFHDRGKEKYLRQDLAFAHKIASSSLFEDVA